MALATATTAFTGIFAMNMSMRNFFFCGCANIYNGSLEMKIIAGKRMVEIHLYRLFSYTNDFSV
jgi:hypothetical protein